MATLTREMKDMIASQQCFIATVSKSGMPNVAPKRSTRVLNDNSLIFTEGTGGATYRNIQDGSVVSVAVVHREALDGYRFIGKPEIQSEGELYDAAAEMSLKMDFPKPYAVIIIHIEEIHSLKPGRFAGKKID
jgi:predicted pyridoxine 5'-phosphate oxidase superfamily flavin-nucleotide-binding protein